MDIIKKIPWWLLFVLTYVGIVSATVVLLIKNNAALCQGQFNTSSLIVALATLLGLAIYAGLTWKITRATEFNTNINRIGLLDLTPSFSFISCYVYSDRGALLIFGDKLTDIWHDVWDFAVFIHNYKSVSGVFRLNFRFGGLVKDKFEDLGFLVLANNILYRNDTRGFRIQAKEILGVSTTINKDVFEAWLDACYPEVKNLTSLSHKVEAILGGGPEPFTKLLPPRMYVEAGLVAYSNPVQKLNPYEFVKNFYIRFNEQNPAKWELIGAPVYEAFA